MKMKTRIFSVAASALIVLSVMFLSSCAGNGNDKFVPFSEMSEEEKEAFLMAEGFEIIQKDDKEDDLPADKKELATESDGSENAEEEGAENASSLPSNNEDADVEKDIESSPEGNAEKEKDANTAEGLSGVLKNSENGKDGDSSEKAAEPDEKSDEKQPPEKSVDSSSKAEKEPEKKTEPSSSGSSGNYVYNKNSKKFHFASCDSVKDMKESNKGFSNDRASLIASGYVPCKRCNP